MMMKVIEIYIFFQAIISPLGQLLTVKNGATAIEVHSLGSMLSHLAEYQKIKQFPGPLIR